MIVVGLHDVSCSLSPCVKLATSNAQTVSQCNMVDQFCFS